jgi:hypothetical protein
MAANPKEGPHLRLRVNPKLLARLEKAREKSGRTLTGEIVSRLESSFRREDHEDLIAATVKETLATLRAYREAEGSPPPPTPPSYGGILGQLTEPRREDTTTKTNEEKSK